MAKAKTGSSSNNSGTNVARKSSGSAPVGSVKKPQSRPQNKGSVAGRQSVAAARRAKPGSDRSQLIIGGIAVVVLAVIVVVGVVIYKNRSAVQNDGYGPSTNSVSTMSNGVVTVKSADSPGTGGGANPAVTIDVYQDALCPVCQQFEHQYGQQIAQAVDQGKLQVRYQMVAILDPSSASKNYSTRAAAALLCVGADTAAPKGTFLKYLTHLYADDTKPAEGGSTDLSNQQLADLAKGDGATATAVSCISAGSNVALATSTNAAKESQMQAATGAVGTPTVLKDGTALDINSTDWLTKLIG